jgi:hypothetical protein
VALAVVDGEREAFAAFGEQLAEEDGGVESAGMDNYGFHWVGGGGVVEAAVVGGGCLFMALKEKVSLI